MNAGSREWIERGVGRNICIQVYIDNIGLGWMRYRTSTVGLSVNLMIAPDG